MRMNSEDKLFYHNIIVQFIPLYSFILYILLYIVFTYSNLQVTLTGKLATIEAQATAIQANLLFYDMHFLIIPTCLHIHRFKKQLA